MSRHKSAKEVEDEYLNVMGPELGGLFHALYLELVWVHWRWKQFRILFGDKPTRIDLLNSSAPFFFRLVQDVFFEDTLLAIARLAGPPATYNKRNLAIGHLPRLMSTPELSKKVADLVAVAENAAAFAKDWRNRHLAHRDLDLAIDGSAKPLAAASREAVENALQALRNVLNSVESAYRNSTTAYDLIPGTEDAEALLYVIRDGLRFDAERRARWERGEMHEDDLNPPPAV